MTDQPPVDNYPLWSCKLFESGYYCAESVLLAIAESRHIKEPFIPRIATGFCSGLARTSGPCGAVSGAVMGLSLVFGRDRPEDTTVEEDYAAVKKFIQDFQERFGTINCTQLLGCDLNTPQGQDFFRENNLHEKCATFVEEATRMALGIIDE